MSTRPLIVLISGWAHSGKDSVAKILVESYDFQKLAFADPIKHHVAREVGIPLEWCYDQEKKAEILVDPKYEGRTLREELIRVAETERAEDKEIWGRAIGEKVAKSIQRGKSKFVVSDWRHIEELWALQKKIPYALIVPIHIQRPSQLVSPVPDRTEYSLLGFPYWRVISNSGTIARLLTQVVELMEVDLPKIWKEEEE
jgi:dephospho-CoA kinase